MAQLEGLVKKFEQIARSRPDPSWGKRLRARRSQLEREKKTAVEKPELNESRLSFKLDTAVNKAKIALTITGLDLGFQGNNLFSKADLQLYCGEKAALVGMNGCGKTSLVKKIMVQSTADHQTIKIGLSLTVGYLSQNQDNLDPGSTITDHICRLGSLNKNEAFRVVSPFLFSYLDMDKKIKNLSGGEKNRLQLASLKYMKADFLILDEPTNHLDIPSREAIEEALIDYEGTLFIISHDRYFLDKIATRIVEVKEKKLVSYSGNFTQFWTDQIRLRIAAKGRLKKRAQYRSQAVKTDKNGGEQELARLEQKIDRLENDKRELEQKVVKALEKGDQQQGKKLNRDLEKLEKILKDVYSQWELHI